MIRQIAFGVASFALTAALIVVSGAQGSALLA